MHILYANMWLQWKNLLINDSIEKVLFALVSQHIYNKFEINLSNCD